MNTTPYFEEIVQRKRRYITKELCERVVAKPIKREIQPNGRIRLWGRIPELGNRVVRVILLADGNTIHNAFLDRGYKG